MTEDKMNDRQSAQAKHISVHSRHRHDKEKQNSSRQILWSRTSFQVRVITVFTVFRLLTDIVCLYNYEFWLSLCKIVRSSVILLLPLFNWETHSSSAGLAGMLLHTYGKFTTWTLKVSLFRTVSFKIWSQSGYNSGIC